jgi:CRP-like cAMP-binding protein
MYIISKGSAACLVKKVEIERLSKGMCFGEVAIMNMCKMRAAGISEEAIARRCVRMADVRALEPCELCALTFDDAWPLIREIPELWVAFEEIAQRRAIRAAVPQLASGKVPPARPLPMRYSLSRP